MSNINIGQAAETTGFQPGARLPWSTVWKRKQMFVGLVTEFSWSFTDLYFLNKAVFLMHFIF